MPRTALANLSRPLAIAGLVSLAAACGGGDLVVPAPKCPPPAGNTSGQDGNGGATADARKPPTVGEAKAFVDRVNQELKALWVKSALAGWVNQTYITDDTDQLSASAEEATMEYLSRVIPEATRFDALTDVPPDVARSLKLIKLATVLPAPDNAAERAELAGIVVAMQSTYGKGKYCPARLKNTKPGKPGADNKDGKKGGKDAPKAKECLTLGDLSNILATSKDYNELLDAWTGWHAIAPPIRDKFRRYVELGNKGSKEIGYKDLGALWRSSYDMTADEFEADIERLWSQVKPLYDELHCYVRARLRQHYGKDKVPSKGPIPAHLLGNMWAQEWNNIYALVEPYAGEASLDVTKSLKDKGYDEKEMVKLGEKFFTSLGLAPLPDTFYERSLFKKPADREVVCHASAWDVSYSGDIRIKMCIEPKEEDLVTIHHELGHNYYYQYYYKLPVLFQQGANDGFHEGIGDTIARSVTPGYLKSIGLLDKVPDNPKAETNFLLKQALDKVAFLPFGKLIDQWRWDVFSGKTKPDDYNKAWWDLRMKYQGVAPPVARTEADFDPGAKYHVPANTPYVRYFLAAIYQFQFHRALCKAAGQTGPLHTCSIYGSKEAGEKLRAMLAMGASRPWPEAMKAISGETQGDASALLEYFEPLRKYLKEQTKGETCGF